MRKYNGIIVVHLQKISNMKTTTRKLTKLAIKDLKSKGQHTGVTSTEKLTLKNTSNIKLKV